MDSVELLKNALQLEAKKNFENKSVVGGLEKLVQKQISKVPLSEKDKDKVRHLFLRYSELNIEERRNAVETLLNLLDTNHTVEEKFIPITKTFVPVQYVKGVGPKLAKVLKKLRITEAFDLLYYFPKEYLDLSRVVKISALSHNGETVVIKGKILRVEEKRARIKLIIVTVGDGSGYIKAVWFNQPYLKDIFKAGQTVVLSGKAQYSYGKWEMPSPDFEILQEGKELIHTMRIIPIYSLTQNLSQKTLRAKIKSVLDMYTPYLIDFVEDEVLKRHNMVPLSKALYNIHFPESFSMLEKSRDRMIFDELFMLQVVLGMRKKEIKSNIGVKFSATQKDIDEFEELLPFTLTKGQREAMEDIVRDVSSGKPMNRLLHGDVGSGKTVVSLFALYLAAKNGYQGAMMSPTEILAQQTFKVAKDILGKARIPVALLTSGTKKKERKQILEGIAEGKIKVLFGTHAIIQQDVLFKNLVLDVVDEQHRFGVIQRGILREKSIFPHTLVMSATPIPRTLALTLYGDLDISQIREMPKGRKPVITKVYISNFNEPYSVLISELRKGHKGYIVCPLVEESEKSELQSVQKKIKELKETYLKDFNLGLMYGGLSSDDKKKVMNQFKNGEIDVLVSTTVVEVGVDVSDATVMIVEDADHFGLSTLHQLRGRVGRGDLQSFCFLLTKSTKKEALDRLRVLEKTSNGFEVAEADLRMRGPGELFGLRQHGLPEFKITSLVRKRDLEILEIAREEAMNFIKGKIQWDDEKKNMLFELIKHRFGDKVDIVEVA